MTALVEDKKSGECLDKNYFCLMTNAAGYHPGPVAPSTADVAPFQPHLIALVHQGTKSIFNLGFSWTQELDIVNLF